MVFRRPHIAVDNNGIVLLLEGDVGAHFYRKNKTHELLSADGVIRVVLKPQFRHSRIFSDVELTGVDFKVYKVCSLLSVLILAQVDGWFFLPR